jgi:aspartate/methionine/tyrosine aminotransferase
MYNLLIIFMETLIMFTPDGQNADKIDKIMLLAMWTNTLKSERDQSGNEIISPLPFISAGMGRPTFPINPHTIQIHLAYWKKIESLTKSTFYSTDKIKEQAVIGYGDPRGDDNSRYIMAEAMSKWYETTIRPDNVLFTVGGAGALRIIFETFNLLYKDMPGYRVITPFPHYTLYADNTHQLHAIDVMKEPGYRLTASSLQSSLDAAFTCAETDGRYPKVFLLCNPNNPLGTIIHEDELTRIADVLRQYPDLHIILDEAYAEMYFGGEKIPSLLKIASDLMPRIIIMRSATKALSAAGERMAILMAFDPDLMSKLLDKNISTIGHAPRSSQIAYAETMAQFTKESHQELVDFYYPKVSYVNSRLKSMGAAMPDLDYSVDGTFYILTDLTDLLGLELPLEAGRALGKTGQVKTNEELAYYLLFSNSIMLAPASYFGLPKQSGVMRITCSGTAGELCDLMDRLESQLIEARRSKKRLLLDDIAHQMNQLDKINKKMHVDMTEKLISVLNKTESAFNIKEQISSLQEINMLLRVQIKQSSDAECVKAAITIQSFFRGHLAYKETLILSKERDKEWEHFIEKLVPQACSMKSYFLRLSVSERLNLSPWIEHLSNGVVDVDSKKFTLK